MRPKSFSGRAHEQNHFQFAHTTKNILRSNTRPKSFSGRTRDQNHFVVAHTTKNILRSNTPPKSLSGRTHDQSLLSRTNESQNAYPQVEHSTKSFSGRNVQTNCKKKTCDRMLQLIQERQKISGKRRQIKNTIR